MSARFLAWYTCGLLAIAWSLSLLVTVAPSAEAGFAVFQSILIIAAVVFAICGVVLSKLPNGHWANNSRSARFLFVAAAVTSTLLLVMSVG